jgi:hypothetical protein
LVEGEVIGLIFLIAKSFSLEFIDLIQIEERDLNFTLVLDFVAQLLVLLLVGTSHVSEDLHGLALVIVGNLLEEVVSVICE